MNWKVQNIKPWPHTWGGSAMRACRKWSLPICIASGRREASAFGFWLCGLSRVALREMPG
jgi:hypothetical protein